MGVSEWETQASRAPGPLEKKPGRLSRASDRAAVGRTIVLEDDEGDEEADNCLLMLKRRLRVACIRTECCMGGGLKKRGKC